MATLSGVGSQKRGLHDGGSSYRRALIPLLLAATAGLMLAVGIDSLILHLKDGDRAFRAPSAVVLLLLGGVLVRVAWEAWRRREHLDVSVLNMRSAFWRWFIAGVVACYAAALLLGPDPNVRYLFRAGAALWTTLLALQYFSQKPLLRSRPNWSRHKLVALSGNAVFALVVVLLTAETGLRGYSLAVGDRSSDVYVVQQHRLPPGSQVRGRQVNNRGYWDKEFASPRQGVFRIAVLGDEVALSGTPESNYVAELERRLADTEVYNFGLPEAGPREYAAQAVGEVARYRPNLVLACISVGDDVTQQLPAPGVFDFQSLQLYQRTVCTLSPQALHASHVSQVLQPAADRESYLRQAGARLAVCRTPLDDRMRRCWDETFQSLDSLLAACSKHNMRVALVVLPAEHQLDDRLRKTLCRRLGANPSRVDVDLPQRRLAVYAGDRQLPMLDLLPHFRAAGECPFARNHHDLNEHGNLVAAETISRWVQRQFASNLDALAQAN